MRPARKNLSNAARISAAALFFALAPLAHAGLFGPDNWALIVLPAETPAGAEPAWLTALKNDGDLKLTVALSPDDLRKLVPFKQELINLCADGRLEPALRLEKDPPLPLIFDMDSLRMFLPEGTPMPNRKVNWPDDVAGRIVKAKFAFKTFFGADPNGLVPGGGSLYVPVAEFLKSRKFLWTIGGFPEAEWPAGAALEINPGEEDALWVLAAHPVSQLFYSPPPEAVPDPAATPSPMTGAQRHAQMVAEGISAAHAEKVLPVLVFDEARSAVTLRGFLQSAAAVGGVAKPSALVLVSRIPKDRMMEPSNALQIWPYSWSWLEGAGLLKGPGLTVWIGDDRKNSAWNFLAQARAEIDRYRNSGRAELDKLDRILEDFYLAEGGEYFERLGSRELNPQEQAALETQEAAFKTALARVYRGLSLTIPGTLKGSLAARRKPLPEQPQDPAAPAQPAEAGQPEPEETERMDLIKDEKASSVSWYRLERESERLQESFLRRFTVRYSSASNDSAVRMSVSYDPDKPIASPVIDVYLDINRREGAGETDLLPGRNGSLPSRDGWEFAATARVTEAKKWEVTLVRASQPGSVVYRTSPRVTKEGGRTILEWALPKGMLGRDPLRWGYLVCIMPKEGAPVLDALSPVRGRTGGTPKPKTEFSTAAAKSSGSEFLFLQMMR